MSKSITNNVTVDYQYTSLGEGCSGQTSCSVTSNISPGSVQAVKSTCLNKIGPDDNIYYIITVSFYGVERNNVVIEDTLPDNLVYNDDAEYRVNNESTTTSIPPVQSGQKLTFNFGAVAGDSIITLKFSVKLPEGAKPSATDCFNNQAFIKYDNCPAGGIPTNVIQNCYSYSLLTASKDAPATAVCGSDINYIITVENSGNEDVTAADITDDFKSLISNPLLDPSFEINMPVDENVLIGNKTVAELEPAVTAVYDDTNKILTVSGVDVPGATFDTNNNKINGQVIITVKGKISCP